MAILLNNKTVQTINNSNKKASTGWNNNKKFYEAAAPGLFVATGQTYLSTYHSRILTSPNGITWTERTPNTGGLAKFEQIAFGNGRFVATGTVHASTNHRFHTSPDGITWTATSPSSGPIYFYDITFGNGLFVAVGMTSSATSSHAGCVFTSTNGAAGVQYSQVKRDQLFGM